MAGAYLLKVLDTDSDEVRFVSFRPYQAWARSFRKGDAEFCLRNSGNYNLVEILYCLYKMSPSARIKFLRYAIMKINFSWEDVKP
jgi:hypothetical protein